MYFLGFLWLLSSAAASPIVTKYDRSQPSEDVSKISYIILEPADFLQLGNYPWNPEVTDNSEGSRIFVLKGIGNKKFGHLNALKQQQQSGVNQFSISDYTEGNKLDGASKIDGINVFDRPCDRYHANEVTAKVNAVEPEVKINSVKEYKNKEEGQKQEQPAFTSNEEVKPVDTLVIPAPPSIDVSTTTVQNQNSLVSDESSYKYQPESYKLVKNKPELNEGQVNSDVSIGISVQPPSSIKSSNLNELWSFQDNNAKEPVTNDLSIVDQYKTKIIDNPVKESDPSEEDTRPIIKLNIPAPPSIDGTITLPSGYSTLSALQNEERMLMEKIKHLKLHIQDQTEKTVDKSSYDYHPELYDIEVVDKKPSIDVSAIHISAQGSKVEKPADTSKVVKNDSDLGYYPKTEGVKKETITLKKEIKPIVKLNIPAPPSLDNTIKLSSGYSSLSDVQNEEGLIQQKVKLGRLNKQEAPEAPVQADISESQSHPEIYKLVKGNINPVFNADNVNNEASVKDVKPVISMDVTSSPSMDSSVGHDTNQWVADTVLDEKHSEVNSEDLTNTKDNKPVVILNIPPPPSIDNSITLPSGYSSIEALQNEERNILRRIKNVRVIKQKQPGQVIESSNFGYHPEHYKVEVVKETPDVNMEDVKPVVTVNIPAPPAIDSSTLYDKNQVVEENNGKTQEQPVYVLHHNNEENYSKTNTEEVNPDESVPNQEPLKPVVPLHIPPPPSIDDAIVLPSGYPTLPAIRNDEIILLQKVKGNIHQVQKQPGKIVKESDNYPAQANRVKVVENQPQPDVVEASQTVKYNVPVPPSLGRSIGLPSGYLTQSNIQDLERWIIQKIKEQRQKQTVKVSEQKVVVPVRNVVGFKPAVKTNIPLPPSIDRVSLSSEYSEYPKQNKVKFVRKLPPVHIRGPVIRWNTPAPPTVTKRVVNVSSGYPSLSVRSNENNE
ncbi:unnamed protein product [Pieris macdunnoughi]|uniref:Uncharacterized protein n=1 Tax=Pieris macdunnoughi TaxID=345717 RepID=A0A821MYI3_9NEOP|nr:unnamed protein product [Pieris macdunnoughi]